MRQFNGPVLTQKPTQGREICTILGIRKPGPWTGQALEKVIEWQLQYPEGKKEDCELWLRDTYKDGKILADNSACSTSLESEQGPTKKAKRT